MRFFSLIVILLLVHVQSSFGQWVQDKNFRGGDIIGDILEFKGDLYAATFSEGLLRSSDNGESWIKLEIADHMPLSKIATHKDTLFCANYGSIYFSTDGEIWSELSGPDTFIRQLFSDGNNLYLVSSSMGIFKSENNGLTWFEINNEETSQGVYSLTKKDNILFAGGPNGILFKSTNEGVSWDKTQIESEYYIDEIYHSENSIYLNLVEEVFRSDNNGDTWSNITASDPSIYQTDPMYVYGSTIYLCNSSTIYKSNDEGNTWIPSVPIDPRYNIESIYVNESYIFLGLWGGGIMRNSHDFYNTWHNENNGIYLNEIQDIEVYNDSIYVGTSYNFIKSSHVDRNDWKQEKNISGYSGTSVRSLAALDDFIFTGDGGTGVQKRKLSDSNWEKSNEGLPNKNIDALATNEKYLFAAVNGHGIYRSNDKGLTWVSKSEGINSGIRSIYTYDSLTFVGTWDGLFMSDDDGDNWKDISNNISNRSTESMVLIDSVLFVATQTGGLQKTSDFGINWSYSINKSIFSIASYHNYLFAGGWYGEVLVSEDLGNTWENISNSQLPDAIVSAINFTEDSILVGLRQNGHGLWKKALHEHVPPVLVFSSEKEDLTLRKDEPIILHSDQHLKNGDGSDLDNDMLSYLISVINQDGEEVNFTAEIDESKKTITIRITEPVDGDSYRVAADSFSNISGLSNSESESPVFTYTENNPPLLADFSVEGMENEEIIIASDHFLASYEDEDDDDLTKIMIEEVPAHGSLYLNSELITAGIEIAAMDLNNLVYHPSEDFTGTDQVTWNAYDGYDYSDESAQITIDVVPITGLEESMLSQFTLYPNPTSDVLNVEFENHQTGLVKIKVMDSFGKQLTEYEFEKSNEKFSHPVELVDLPDGVYFLHLTQGEITEVRKIIKK